MVLLALIFLAFNTGKLPFLSENCIEVVGQDENCVHSECFESEELSI